MSLPVVESFALTASWSFAYYQLYVAMHNSAVPIPLYSRVFLSATASIFLKCLKKNNRWLQFYVFIIFVAVTSVYKIPIYLAFSPLACYFLSLIPFSVVISDFLEAELYEWYDLHFLPFSIDMNLTKHSTEPCLWWTVLLTKRKYWNTERR